MVAKSKIIIILKFSLILVIASADSAQAKSLSPQNSTLVQFGLQADFPDIPGKLVKYLLARKGKTPTHLKDYLLEKGYPKNKIQAQLLQQLWKALNDNYPELKRRQSSEDIETWIRQWLYFHYGIQPLPGKIVIIFNVHGGRDFRELADLFDQIQAEEQYSKIIWVLEDALLFTDLISQVDPSELKAHDNEITSLLTKRLNEDPMQRLEEINNLRIPIKDNRINYIPRLIDTPRIEYLLQHPSIGLTLESLNDDLNIEHVHSILLAAAFKWRASSALINEGDEDLFFKFMVKSISHYLKSHIHQRDQLLAKKLYQLAEHYPHTLIFIDRGVDHIYSLLGYLEGQDFQEMNITSYYPIAYQEENFSFLHFDQDLIRLKEKRLKRGEINKLLNDFKRYFLHEMLSGTMAFHFPSASSLAIANIAKNYLNAMSDEDVTLMLQDIETKNKTMTQKEKQKASGHDLLKWFIQYGFVISVQDIRRNLSMQPIGFIKNVKIIGE